MVAAAFAIDTRDLIAYARSLGAGGVKIVGDELTTATYGSLQDVKAAATKRVKHRSGRYAQAFAIRVTVSAAQTVGTLTNAAASATGFVYAETLEFGRGPVHALKAKALRFEVNGVVLFRKSVGPAKAQHPMEYGLADAQPQIEARFERAMARIASRLEAL